MHFIALLCFGKGNLKKDKIMIFEIINNIKKTNNTL